MSYIRCTSNPDGLYVYHNVDGYMDFMIGGKTHKIPVNIFRTFIREIGDKYHGFFGINFKKGSLEVKEVFIKSRKKRDKILKALDFYPGSYKMQLYYKGNLICSLWLVTWQYVANGIYRDIKRKQKK